MPNETPLPYQMKPVVAFGQKTSPLSALYAEPTTSGVLQSLGRATAFSLSKAAGEWEFTWDLMTYEGPSVSPAYWDSEVGERDMPFRPHVSADELDRLVKQYDNDQYIGKYEPDSVPARVAAMLGHMAGSSFGPAAVETMFLGGALFKAAASAKTAREALILSMKGGALQGAGSAALDANRQLAQHGELSVKDILINAAAPVVLGVPMALGGRAVARMLDPDAARAYTQSTAFRASDDPQEAAQSLHGVEPPPRSLYKPPPPDEQPTRWVKQVNESGFVEYEGGVRQWFRDLAAGNETARIKAQQLRLDTDDPVLQALMRKVGHQTDTTSSTPVDYNALLLQDMRSLSPEGRSRLRQNGVLTVGDEVRQPYESLFTAATTEPGARSPEQTALVQDFVERGAGPIRTSVRKEIDAEIKGLRKELSVLRDLTRGSKKSKRLTQMRQEAARVKNKILGLEIRKENYAGADTNRVLDDSVSDTEIMETLTTLAQTRAVDEGEAIPMTPATRVAASEAMAGDVVDDPELMAWAVESANDLQARGVMEEDALNEVNTLMDNFKEAVRVCQRD